MGLYQICIKFVSNLRLFWPRSGPSKVKTWGISEAILAIWRAGQDSLFDTNLIQITIKIFSINCISITYHQISVPSLGTIDRKDIR